jgi:sugar phosphate permease
MGIGFGSFGPLLLANEAHLGVGRGAVALGMSLISLAAAVSAAVAGRMMQHFRARDVMVTGVIMSAIAYLVLAFTESFAFFLFSYIFIGAGIALSGILSPLTLVSRWVPQQRGKALSAVNVPVVMFFCPSIIGLVLPEIGRAALLLTFSCLLVALVPLLFFLVEERPPSIIGGAQPAEAAAQVPVKPEGQQVLRRAPFWLISAGVGILNGCGTVFVVHITAFGGTRGLSAVSASALLSIYAGAGLIGTPLFGWVADRFRPANALAICSVLLALLWLTLLMAEGPILLLIAAAIGVCSTPLIMLHGTALAFYFDAATVSRAMGYSYMFKLPLTFTLAPLAGALFEATGEYKVPFLLSSALTAAAAISFLYLSLRGTHQTTS